MAAVLLWIGVVDSNASLSMNLTGTSNTPSRDPPISVLFCCLVEVTAARRICLLYCPNKIHLTSLMFFHEFIWRPKPQGGKDGRFVEPMLRVSVIER